jgi:hypothetical protein
MLGLSHDRDATPDWRTEVWSLDTFGPDFWTLVPWSASARTVYQPCVGVDTQVHLQSSCMES